VKKMALLSSEINLSLPVLSLAWCLKNPNVSTVILGASKEKQLIENLESIDAQEKLIEEIMQKIEEILDNKKELAPY
jgi:aryl-alcohol dehydrogenase-like predicted oxidoreductase